MPSTNNGAATKTGAQGRGAVGLFNFGEQSQTLDKPNTARQYQTYREMRTDPTIALARWLVIAPVVLSAWSVESRDDAPEGARDFIDDQMQSIRLHLLKTAMEGYIDYGWQPYEKILEPRDDGNIGIAKLKPLYQDTTDILVDSKTGAYAGLAVNDDTVELLVDETLCITLDYEGTDWYGRAVMENVREPYDKHKKVDESADRYDRKIAGSHWVIWYPLGSSRLQGQDIENFELAQRMLRSLESSGALVIPRIAREMIDDLNRQAQGTDDNSGWKVELLSDTGRGQAGFIERQKYLDALKVRGFGVPERAVLEGTFGTKAEAVAHADFAITNMELRHHLIVQPVNWHLINQLLRLNWGKKAENSVWVTPSPIADAARTFLQQIYSQLLATPDGALNELAEVDMEAMREKLSIPQLPEPEVPVGGLLDPGTIADGVPLSPNPGELLNG